MRKSLIASQRGYSQLVTWSSRHQKSHLVTKLGHLVTKVGQLVTGVGQLVTIYNILF